MPALKPATIGQKFLTDCGQNRPLTTSKDSLADLYDELTMPVELRKAHQANDRAVMKAYGFPIKDFTEEDCVAELMKMYQKLVESDMK